MQNNNNKKFLDNLVSRTKIYLIIILLLLIAISIQNTKFIIPSIFIFVLVSAYTYFANNKRKSEISEQLQDLTLTVDSAAKSSLINSPFPLVILETNGNIVWIIGYRLDDRYKVTTSTSIIFKISVKE